MNIENQIPYRSREKYFSNNPPVLQNLDPYINAQPKTRPPKHYEKPTITYDAKTPRQQKRITERISNPEGSVKHNDGSCSHKANTRLRTGTDSTKGNQSRPHKDTFDVSCLNDYRHIVESINSIMRIVIKVICNVASELFRAELHLIIKEKDEAINELKKDIIALKKVYDVKLAVAHKEITVLKENLCAVKRIKEIKDNDSISTKKRLVEARKEIDRLKKLNTALHTENEKFVKLVSNIKSSPSHAHRKNHNGMY